MLQAICQERLGVWRSETRNLILENQLFFGVGIHYVDEEVGKCVAGKEVARR
jgi:hypothetical protein